MKFEIASTKQLGYIFGALLWVAAVPGAQAGAIIQDSTNSSVQVQYAETVGQSFTAEDANIQSIGVYMLTYNPSNPNDALTMMLHDGVGLGGSVLGTVHFTLASGFNGYYDADFSGVTLTVGNVYTMSLATDTTSPYWGIEKAGNLYSGGEAYLFSTASPNQDLRFRVLPGTASVPEPASLALLGLGLFGLGFSRRKKA